MLLRIHADNPDPRQIKKVVDCLKDGGVIIYPTDTVYAYVPAALVFAVIVKHGGMVSGELPNGIPGCIPELL